MSGHGGPGDAIADGSSVFQGKKSWNRVVRGDGFRENEGTGLD